MVYLNFLYNKLFYTKAFRMFSSIMLMMCLFNITFLRITLQSHEKLFLIRKLYQRTNLLDIIIFEASWFWIHCLKCEVCLCFGRFFNNIINVFEQRGHCVRHKQKTFISPVLLHSWECNLEKLQSFSAKCSLMSCVTLCV